MSTININIPIFNVSVKRSETDHELLSVENFIKIPIAERNKLIMSRAVQFFDEHGQTIPLVTAMAMLTDILKQLREQGAKIVFSGNA